MFFKNFVYGEIWLKMLQEVIIFYVFVVLEVMYFIDDIDFECFVCVFSNNDEIIIVGGSYCNL